jgi:RNA polymerase sigma-70 factor (ECF subfamily)
VGGRDQAEDLTQDVFIRVFENLSTYRSELAAFPHWVRRIVRNLLIDDYRRTRKDRRLVSRDGAHEQLELILSLIQSHEPNPHAVMERRERRSALFEALRLLSRELREVVILRDLQGLGYEEIGDLLKIPLGTVKSRINRGRIELVKLVRQRLAARPAVGADAPAAA